ncbi:MAG: RDD family protein [Tannerella sp.]|jgi:uncharacterized RDD family membrane protein YckC|nr:RDD family protein [Tannerella sp.]
MSETSIITSQYVEIEQTPAGVGERIFARIIDYIIMFVFLMGFYYFISEVQLTDVASNDIELLIAFIWMLPAVFYSLIWEIFNRGRSPGKMAFGMRVVMRDGSTPTLGGYFLRWMLLLIDVYCSWAGIVVILLNKNNQRLGDLAAGTVVIKERDYKRIHVSLDEFDHLTRGYHPVYLQAENLSLEQVSTITETLTRNDVNRTRRIAHLSIKVREFLAIDPPSDDEIFLQTLIRDYQYFVLEEI